MSERINTILILGAAGGIGEAVARRFHSMGNNLLAHRVHERNTLERMADDLPDLSIRTWDLTDLDQMEAQVEKVLADFPKLDTIFFNAGIQNHYNIFEQQPDQAEILRELTTDLTAPILIAHYFARHLLDLAMTGVNTNIFLTSSSLAYFPVPFYPIYCPSKAGIAAFTKVLRSQLEATDCKFMNVIEVVPPYVDTPLNAAHRDQTDALQGGKETAVQPMPLDDYIEGFFAALERTQPDGSFANEIGVGFGAVGAKIWHEGNRKLLNSSGMTD